MNKYPLDIITDNATLISAVLKDIYVLALLIAIIILIFAFVLKFKENSSPQARLNMALSCLITLVVMAIVPIIIPGLRNAFKEWGFQYAKEVNNVLMNLCKLKIDKDWYNPTTYIYAGFYSLSSVGAMLIRDLVKIFMDIMFNCLISISPIFIAFCVFPATKSIGTNYFTTLFGMILLPVAFLFGDIFAIKMAGYLISIIGAATTTSAASAGITAVLVGTAIGPAVAAAGAIGMIAFSGCYFIVIVTVYIGIPWGIIMLMRGSSFGQGVSSAVNTASNVMTMANTSTGSSIGKGLSKSPGATSSVGNNK